MSRPHDFEHFKKVAAQKFTHTMLNILSHALMENVCQLKGYHLVCHDRMILNIFKIVRFRNANDEDT